MLCEPHLRKLEQDGLRSRGIIWRMKPRIHINDVAVRDGFQIEKTLIATETKVALIDALSDTGPAKIETTSFVHPKLVPNMADAAEVLSNIRRVPGVKYAVLVPNLKGMERAIATHRHGGPIDEINVVMSVSGKRTIVPTSTAPAKSRSPILPVMIGMAKAGIRMNGTLSTTFGCPFEALCRRNGS